MAKILVTGANGQLGKEFRDLSPAFPAHEFLFLSREDLPIHHFELVRNVFKSFKPDFCINCAAYTAVDKAEQEKDLAYLVNAESVGVIAAVPAVPPWAPPPAVVVEDLHIRVCSDVVPSKDM